MAAVAVGNVAAAADVGCRRGPLDSFVTAYWSAVLAHDTSRLPQAADIRVTENGVPLPLGRGVWQTIRSAGPHSVLIQDLQAGQVVTTAQIGEGERPALLVARMKIVDCRVRELETVVARRETTPYLRPEGWTQAQELLMEPLDAEGRGTRSALIRVAESYFDRLPDAARPLPPLDDRCNRIENGVRTTNNPDPFPGVDPPPLNPAVSRLSCAQQFAAAGLSFVSRVRARRYPVVDVGRGVVVALVMFDHDGTVAGGPPSSIRLSAALPSPYSYLVAEIFKIEAGRIRDIHALTCLLPFGMPSAWP